MPSRSRSVKKKANGHVQNERDSLDLDRLTTERPPPIAWPTICLSMTATVCSLGVYTDMILREGALDAWKHVKLADILFRDPLWKASPQSLLPALIASCLLTILAFVHFTPMHDACHGAIATTKSRVKWLNGLIGRISAVFLIAIFPPFKVLHLEHHRYTNDPNHDPDHYTTRGPALVLPLKWLTIMPHYYSMYLPRLIRGQRKRSETVETLISFLVKFTILMYGWCMYNVKRSSNMNRQWYRACSGGTWLGYGSLVFLGCMVPGICALALLAFSFDFLPHRPGLTKDKYRNTAILKAPYNFWAINTSVLLFQNYHAVHHLCPWVPFYRYSAVYWRNKDTLHSRGTPLMNLTPLFVDKSHCDEQVRPSTVKCKT